MAPITWAPSAAKRWAIAFPIPLVAPVTRTTLSCKRMLGWRAPRGIAFRCNRTCKLIACCWGDGWLNEMKSEARGRPRRSRTPGPKSLGAGTAIYQPNNGGPTPQRVYDFTLTANPAQSSSPDWGTAVFQVNYASAIVGVTLRFPNSTVNAPVSPGTILVQSRPLELIDTPEPSTFGMLGTTGLLVLAAGWKRSRRT